MPKLTFSGHDSFTCKGLWLKKGVDFVKSGRNFSDKKAVVELGVGSNMVAAIRYWLRAFGLMNNDGNPSRLASYLFDRNGKDPYLEYLGSLWLLHYRLVNTNRASIYNIIFNEFRKERTAFTKEKLHDCLKRKCEETGTKYNPNTIEKDINVFKRTYTKPENERVSIEDDSFRLFTELALVKYKLNGNKTGWFQIEDSNRQDLPYQIVLYSIINNLSYGNSISFKELQVGKNSPGLIFAIDTESLLNKIEEIIANYPQAVFTDTAGTRVLQFKTKPEKWCVLDDYYRA